MSIANSFAYTKTTFDWPAFAQATRNQYMVVSHRKYTSKKPGIPDGVNLTLRIMFDDKDYGVDKEGNQRENNVNQTFDVVVFNTDLLDTISKDSIVALYDYDEEHSYVIKFDLILRFGNAKVLKSTQPHRTGMKQDA